MAAAPLTPPPTELTPPELSNFIVDSLAETKLVLSPVSSKIEAVSEIHFQEG